MEHLFYSGPCGDTEFYMGCEFVEEEPWQPLGTVCHREPSGFTNEVAFAFMNKSVDAGIQPSVIQFMDQFRRVGPIAVDASIKLFGRYHGPRTTEIGFNSCGYVAFESYPP